MIIILILLLGLPSHAYNSGNAIIIRRKSPQRRALLDRKFVFMNEAPAFKQSTSRQRSSHSKGLNTMSSNLKKVPLARSNGIASPSGLAMTVAPSPEPRALSPEQLNHQDFGDLKEDIYDESNWDDYAQEVELEENLSVQARIK